MSTLSENLLRLADAKENIAEAITNKGVEVGETDGFESFAEKINGIQTGGGKDTTGTLLKNICIAGTELPFANYMSGAVMYKGELHVIGYSGHYKWTGSEWVKVSTYTGRRNMVVVYDGLIYFVYYNGSRYYLYTSDGNEDTKVGLISGFGTIAAASLIVYNNELHLFGDNTTHRIYNGVSSGETRWKTGFTSRSASKSCVIVHNGELHILGGESGTYDVGTTYHYKYDGTSWITASTLPYAFIYGYAFSVNNEIHIMGGYDKTSNPFRNHYKWNGTSWTSCQSLTHSSYNGAGVIVNESKIIILGSDNYQSSTNNKGVCVCFP